MLRIPVCARTIPQKYSWTRLHSSSSFIRSTFIDYFKGNGHKVVRSSSVVPLCDPTVPFVNAGMNQFKGVFLGKVQPPCLRAVNSQKCVRVGGKHNDLDVVGTDGHHHTFFEMMGNWSFGDYYKKEACQMAWDLLLGPYRLKPEQLVVTYFAGDPIIGLVEDRECRDIWKAIGVPADRLKALDAKDNFWEMGATGPCGPCTEIHYVNPDGSLTEIWNLVFIQCNRESDGKVTGLRTHHVDTGMGLERITALLQGVPSNYDTDLFLPIIRAIEQKSKGVPKYSGIFGNDAVMDSAYRRLADHSRMISVCLADGVYPATSLNLKQILRKSFKISSDIFQCNSGMLSHLYDIVCESLSPTYPELLAKRKEAQLILQYEEESYAKLRGNMAKKWRDLSKAYPEIEQLSDVELAGFVSGYKEFKETMAKQNAAVIPGELVFKLYDTHGFQEDVINRIAELNNLEIDKKTFWKLLSQHKNRHKTAFKEQTDKKGVQFDQAIEKLIENGFQRTNDQYKYDYTLKGNTLTFGPLKTSLVAIFNKDGDMLDFSEPSESKPYYLVTKDTNFYCEEGGQSADVGSIQINKDMNFNVESVFKIRDFVFHKGCFKNDSSDSVYVSSRSDVVLNVNSEKRLKTMRNHTAIHLLNAAIRKVLPNSVVCQIGSNVSEKGLVLNMSVYGDKLSQKVVNDAQNLVRETIQLNALIKTSTLDSVQLSMEDSVQTVPGETYPEVGLRLVTAEADGLVSKELCCGTHLPTTGLVGDFCVTLVKGAGSHTPALHAITGDAALEARELYCRAQKLQHVIELIDPERMKQEAADIKRELTSLCGTSGAPHSEYAECLALLDTLIKQSKKNEFSLETIALAEVRELADQVTSQGRQFMVHFLRCSYLMQRAPVKTALTAAATTPAMLLACANGTIHVACSIPESMVTSQFTAERWLSCVLPVFQATMLAPKPGESTTTVAEMSGTKVSLITCEQLVQDAMRAAIKFADAHTKQQQKMRGLEVKSEGDDSDGRQDRRSN